MMRVSVDMSRCQVYAQCVRACPQVFDVDERGNLSVRIDTGSDDALAGRLRRAARLCPTRAIRVQDAGVTHDA